MKHILPTLTLTTLAAAASAQAAAGLNYNYVGFTRQSDDNTLTAQWEKSNVLIRAGASTDYESILSVGYVFKNLALGVDAALLANNTTGHGYDSSYSIELRRSLGEILPGLEIGFNYVDTWNDGQSTYMISHGAYEYAERAWSVELAYNVTKQIQVAVAYADFKDNDEEAVVTVRLAY